MQINSHKSLYNKELGGTIPMEGKVVVVGMGNVLRADDGVGPELIKRLKAKFSPSPLRGEGRGEGWISPSCFVSLHSTKQSRGGKICPRGLWRRQILLDVGTAPENYLGKIVQEEPDTILIVDALDLGLAPGEYQILTKDEILNCGFSTHDISPKMLIEYLENHTKANIYILGVQPETLSFGQPMSASVKQALKEITDLIAKTDRFPNQSGTCPISNRRSVP